MCALHATIPDVCQEPTATEEELQQPTESKTSRMLDVCKDALSATNAIVVYNRQKACALRGVACAHHLTQSIAWSFTCALAAICVPPCAQERFLRNGQIVGLMGKEGSFLVLNGAMRATSWTSARAVGEKSVGIEQRASNSLASPPCDAIGRALGWVGFDSCKMESSALHDACNKALARAKKRVKASSEADEEYKQLVKELRQVQLLDAARLCD